MSANLTLTAFDDLNGETFGTTARTGVGEAGGGGGRAIIFNGTNQSGVTGNLPASPWNSLGAFKVIFRMREAVATGGRVFYLNQGQLALLASSDTRIDLGDARDSLTVFHTPNTITDVVAKIQYDPANSRWTIESWKADGTGYVSTTLGLTTTTNWDVSGQKLAIGATEFNTANLAAKFDWFGIQQGVDALGSGNFPGAEIPGGTYMIKFTFDANNGADTSGAGLDLTLVGSPTFEDTP